MNFVKKIILSLLMFFFVLGEGFFLFIGKIYQESKTIHDQYLHGKIILFGLLFVLTFQLKVLPYPLGRLAITNLFFKKCDGGRDG
jgi:hypothetical protein